MKALALLLLVACEKSGPVEATPGSAVSHPPEAPAPLVGDAGVSTLEHRAAIADAAPLATADAGPTRSRDTRVVTAHEDSASVIAEMIAADDGLTGDMVARRPGADLGKQLDDLAASRGGTGGGGKIGTARGPSAPSPGAAPLGRISVARKQALDDTSLTAELVLRKLLSAYLGSMKRCYTTYLGKDPASRGKLSLAFTVDPSGHTVATKATGFAPELDACVVALMPSWRFGVPLDQRGGPTTARFVIDLHLIPD